VFTEYIISNIQIYSKSGSGQSEVNISRIFDSFFLKQNLKIPAVHPSVEYGAVLMESALTNQSASDWSLHLLHVTAALELCPSATEIRVAVGSSSDLITKP
jgi:hypothetical protein